MSYVIEATSTDRNVDVQLASPLNVSVSATSGGGSGPGVIADPIWDAKGDLAVGSLPDAAARLGVGANGSVLTANSAQPLGMSWVQPAAVGLVTAAQQSANFTAVANTVHPVDCTSASVTATLPVPTADGVQCAFVLTGATAPNVLTVNAGAGGHYNTTTGLTSKQLVNPGDVLWAIYSLATNVWLVLVDPLRTLADGTQITWDTTTAGQIKPVLSANMSATSLRLASTAANSGLSLAAVRCCTIAPLTTTYVAGSGGAGATLTATANGVIPLSAFDNVQLAVNDRVLVNWQTNGYENGLYIVTDPGTASTPYILTRAVDADTGPDLNCSVEVHVQQGIIWGGSTLRSYPPTTGITVGTTALKWYGIARPQISYADLQSSDRQRKQFAHEFADVGAGPFATTNTKLPGGTGGFTVFLSGTAAQITNSESSEPIIDGCIDVSTGTDTTGRCAIAAVRGGVVPNWSSTSRYRFFARLKIPTLT